MIRLYVVAGVPEDFTFATRTKKEISEIAWHKVSGTEHRAEPHPTEAHPLRPPDIRRTLSSSHLIVCLIACGLSNAQLKELPSTKEDAAKDDHKKKFWMVAPFISRLRRYLADQVCHGRAGAKPLAGASPRKTAPFPSPDPAFSGEAEEAAQGTEECGCCAVSSAATARCLRHFHLPERVVQQHAYCRIEQRRRATSRGCTERTGCRQRGNGGFVGAAWHQEP